MNPSDVRLDALGFPIPRTFDDLQAAAPRRYAASRRTGTRTMRVVLVALGRRRRRHGGGACRAGRAGRQERSPSGWPVTAQQKYDTDDLDGASHDLDRAVAWSDKSPVIFGARPGPLGERRFAGQPGRLQQEHRSRAQFHVTCT